ncbi:hypothetical protein EIJ12_23985 [Xanthomonas perforans]|nr:hypothetical protein DB854_24040 [Xanthomonas perforans]TQS94613.1 hypothetical protein EII98_23200 [Xanthomonas perforans]TQT04584.1 hypothetical protein EII99_22830 [Xanthomonas perforans]TQT09270.1 hypothetical protein EIJ05_24365 [Xanthomonas perforans]TQT09362.1 hypothetical protein EIJ11_23975 [Xanthomonas perforans]
MAAVLGLFQEGVAMSTAPSMPASVPVDLLPASAHRLLLDVAEVLLSTPRNSMPAKTRGLRLMLITELSGR